MIEPPPHPESSASTSPLARPSAAVRRAVGALAAAARRGLPAAFGAVRLGFASVGWWWGTAVAALLVVAGGLAWRSSAGTARAHESRSVPPLDPATAPIDPCMPEVLAPAGGRVVSGRVEGGSVLEALRERALGPEELYRLRQAFQGVPGWPAADAGRFAVVLGPGGAVERFHLVVSPTAIDRATTDAAGTLVGTRVVDPLQVRLCHATVRLGEGDLAAALESSSFPRELAIALQAAFAGRVDLAAAPAGSTLRIVARELVALDVVAGYDGVAVAEYRVGGEQGDAAAVRAHGPLDGAARAALDARLDAIAWQEPPIATRPATSPDDDDDEDTSIVDDPLPDPALTVDEAARSSCSTRIVAGLSKQIIAESRCLDADAFVRVPPRKNLVASPTVFLYLEAPARDRLLEVLDAHPDVTMTVNSALRTVAQQHLLSRWGARGRCGVKLAAKPSESNHETGLALDVKESGTWRKPLEAAGFRWMGKKDPVHFDFAGPRAVDHRGLDVRAFQRLWNRNHPDDRVPETGKLDARSASRLARSPAAGFPVGARCGA